ncbi:MAG: hypothetical protein PHU59_05290 [Candidatus Omnitrophica bacterium]|jgi:chromosome segregation ATPase|nr:hypothetical protein [Candidatus Omnitrophota bacterium]
MEQKTKFIIIGLIGFCVVCLFLFLQATSSKQMVIRERNDLKSENTTLIGKINSLENELNSNKSKIDSLKVDRDKAVADLGDLQQKFELASKARDELIEKLKGGPQQLEGIQSEIVVQNTDAYWGAILKAKTDLEMQLTGLRGELRNMQINNESLQRDKSALELDVNSMRNEKQDLLRQLDYNQKLLDSLSQEVVRERNDKVKIKDNFKTIKNENTVLIRQLGTLNSHKSSLDRKVQSLQVGKDTIEKRLSEMETMLTERISQINALKDQLDAIKTGKPVVVSEESKSRESVELPAIVVRSTNTVKRESPIAADAPVSSGKILAVNQDNNFVVIDLGASVGIKHGNTFSVYREGKNIGSIVVIQARDNISACDIKATSTPLRIGDIVR